MQQKLETFELNAPGYFYFHMNCFMIFYLIVELCACKMSSKNSYQFLSYEDLNSVSFFYSRPCSVFFKRKI
jgi:hypothetical protein